MQILNGKRSNMFLLFIYLKNENIFFKKTTFITKQVLQILAYYCCFSFLSAFPFWYVGTFLSWVSHIFFLGFNQWPSTLCLCKCEAEVANSWNFHQGKHKHSSYSKSFRKKCNDYKIYEGGWSSNWKSSWNIIKIMIVLPLLLTTTL